MGATSKLVWGVKAKRRVREEEGKLVKSKIIINKLSEKGRINNLFGSGANY